MESVLVEVCMVKYLVISFDSNLTWKNHVDELCLKLSKTVGIFSKLRYYVNVDILIMLYYSLIYPFLTYGPKTSNYFAKMNCQINDFSDPRSHSEPLLKSLRLLKFSDVIHLEILSFVYQWYHKLSPVSSIHSYNTHQSQVDNLFVKSVHTTQYGIRSLSYTGPKLWNSLSINVKRIMPFSSFCQYIKNSVIDGYNSIIDS